MASVSGQPAPLSGAGLGIASMALALGTFMQVLDTTIANVAMPHMQAQLSATLEQVAWVLTSYILASAVATPVTGSIETLIGRRNLFVICVAGFTIASTMCGAAPTLTAMVASRVLQGLFGAMLMPLSQAVLLDIYPPEGRAKAITIWSIGTMIGPIFGPVVGGWLTESINWRWIFYINVPIGILCTAWLWLLLDPGRAAEPHSAPMPQRDSLTALRGSVAMDVLARRLAHIEHAARKVARLAARPVIEDI